MASVQRRVRRRASVLRKRGRRTAGRRPEEGRIVRQDFFFNSFGGEIEAGDDDAIVAIGERHVRFDGGDDDADRGAYEIMKAASRENEWMQQVAASCKMCAKPEAEEGPNVVLANSCVYRAGRPKS